MCCFIHAIHYDRSPEYLTDIVQLAITTVTRLRSGLRYSFILTMNTTLGHCYALYVRRASILIFWCIHMKRSLADNIRSASGVTRVGVTRAATDGVTPIFPEKTNNLFLVIAVSKMMTIC